MQTALCIKNIVCFTYMEKLCFPFHEDSDNFWTGN